MLQLHWSESESDVAWNGYLNSPDVCLHWSECDFAWKLGYNPFWSDIASDISLSLLLQYSCTHKVHLYWSESESETSLSMSLQNGLQPNFQANLLSIQCKHTTGESRYPFQTTLLSLSLQCNCSIKPLLSCAGINCCYLNLDS